MHETEENKSESFISISSPKKLHKRGVAVSDSEPVFYADFKRIALETRDDHVFVNSTLSIGTRLPLFIHAQYVSLKLGLGKHDFIDASLSGFEITNSTRDIQLDALIKFPNGDLVSDSVASLFVDLGREHMGTSIQFQGFSFGPSKDHRYTLFDKLNFDIPKPVLKVIYNTINTPKVSNTKSDIISPDLPSMFKVTLVQESFMDMKVPNIKISNIDITVQGQFVYLDATLDVINNLPVSLGIAYLSCSLEVNEVHLLDASIEGINILPGFGTTNAKFRVIHSFILFIN